MLTCLCRASDCDSDADICDAKHIVLTCLSTASHVTVMLTYVMLTCDADICDADSM